MLALGALTAVEKNLPWGRRLTRPLGFALIFVAIWSVASVA
jgi:predicted metal-binding membrane protein